MNRSQIKTGVVLTYISLIVGSMATFIYTPFMLRMLGQSEYGIFSLVNTTIAYLTIFDFGFGTAIIRYTAKYRAEQDKVKEETLHGMLLVLYVGIGIIAFLLALIFVFNIDRFFLGSLTASELRTAKLLMWLAAINVAISFPFSVYSSIIIAYERFVFAKVITIVRLVINPLLMVSVLTLGYRAVGMIATITLLNLFINIVNMFYCKRRLQVKMRFSGFNLSLLKEIGAYSFYIFLNMVADRIYWNTGQFLLGIFSGTVAVSIYAVGVQFVTMLYIPVSTAISGLFMPRITQISVKESAQSELSDLFIRVGRIQFIILALVLTGFGLYGQQFVNLWAGPEYATSYIVAIVMMIPLAIPLIQNLGTSILLAKNMHAFRSVVFLVIAVINVVVSIPLIKLWGTVGCAVGGALTFTIGQLVIMNIYYYMHLKLEIGKFFREIGKMLPAVLLPCGQGVLLLHWLSADNLIRFVLNVVLYLVTYVLSMYLFGMNRYEKELILNPLKRLYRNVSMIKY